PFSSWPAESVAFLVGIHDIGKTDAYFQHQVPEFKKDLEDAGYFPTGDSHYRHERLSAHFLKNWLLENEISTRVADALSRAVLVHHGYWEEGFRPVGMKYADAQQSLAMMLYRILGSPSFPQEQASDLSALGMCLAGHIVLSDWIASNEDFFCDARLHSIDDPEKYFPAVREVAMEWVKRLDLRRNPSSGHANRVVANARPLQALLLDTEIPPSLVIIEAPMGEGKTEAAWILAEKWREQGYNGTYMALPTMATSDSLYSRYRDDYLGKMGFGSSVHLVHGMAWLRDDKEPEKTPETGEPGDDRFLVSAWFRPTRRAMLAAHGVGTVDQAMLAGMNVKFGFLRLYGLTGRVLVIDEVHAYDAYMSAIIARLLQWCSCLGIPVILLSATLSSEQRREMIEAYGCVAVAAERVSPYPLVTVAERGKEVRSFATEASSQRKLKIELLPGLLGKADSVAEKAEELVENGGCCCVILNTVKQAQAVYKALHLPKNQKLLFHARFNASDRLRITERVLQLFGKDTSARPEKFVLVATQVVEQSLDVDFDHMISEIAPIDLLLQRSGREHRHRKREGEPVFHVLLPNLDFGEEEPEFGGTGYVYTKKPLLRTLAILCMYREFHLPSDFRMLVETCYGKELCVQEHFPRKLIEQADLEWEKEKHLLHEKGNRFALEAPTAKRFRPVNNEPSGDDSDDGNGWRAQTRIGANDRTAILVDEEEIAFLEKGDLKMREIRDLYRRSLKLPAYLPIFAPLEGFAPAVEAKGKLRGLVLLPLNQDGVWRGRIQKRSYEVVYDKELGLVAGRVE
ncbi:MAG: CRISPR-associated helicase Cas3', partial [Verrucomicrobiae bacterium]|nr:CRISPR-associated helicase Cas3' [Verrucomicrobiae bacterium]